jgi:polar amino acid transport system ATP-binding protein
MELVQVWGLRKEYGKQIALGGVDLTVREGEVVVIMGPSGCGKSTLVRCLNRLTEPDEGEIFFQGKDMLKLDPDELRLVRRQIGFVFQHFNLIERLTVLENVMFPLLFCGVEEDIAKRRAAHLLKQVGIVEELERFPRELSGGQKQRVGIARALANSPKLMIWDEPTASLDPIIVGEVLSVMEELVRHGETTMVIVTHEVPFAMKVAHRIVLMDQGRIVEEGTREEIFLQPKSWVGARYRELLVKESYGGYCQTWKNMA